LYKYLCTLTPKNRQGVYVLNLQLMFTLLLHMSSHFLTIWLKIQWSMFGNIDKLLSFLKLLFQGTSDWKIRETTTIFLSIHLRKNEILRIIINLRLHKRISLWTFRFQKNLFISVSQPSTCKIKKQPRVITKSNLTRIICTQRFIHEWRHIEKTWTC